MLGKSASFKMSSSLSDLAGSSFLSRSRLFLYSSRASGEGAVGSGDLGSEDNICKSQEIKFGLESRRVFLVEQNCIRGPDRRSREMLEVSILERGLGSSPPSLDTFK